MFCGKCGAQNPDGAAFCSKCGAPLTVADAPAAPASDAKKHRFIGIAAVGIAVLLVVILLIALFSGRSANSAAKSFAEAVFEGNGDDIVDLIPKDVIKAYAKSQGLSTRRAREEMADEFDRSFNSISELMDDVKFSFKVTGDEKYGASQSTSVIERYKSMDVKVKDAKMVIIRVTIRSHGEKLELSEPIRVPVIKVGGSWYVDFVNLSDSFTYSLFSALTSALWGF